MPTSRGPRSPSTGSGQGAGPGRRPSAGRSGLRGTGARPGDRTSSRTRAGSADNRRPGATRKPASTASAPPEETIPTITRDGSRSAGAARQRASVTTRAIALAVVLLILTISYASSLRVYFNQRQDLAATRDQIIASQQDINNLSDEITRWNDPDYVRTQARIRLGWVIPGERGYRVIGPDGKPISGEDDIAGGAAKPAPREAWYAKLMGSVQAADHPKPAEPDPADAPPITKNTKPGSQQSNRTSEPTSKPTG